MASALIQLTCARVYRRGGRKESESCPRALARWCRSPCRSGILGADSIARRNDYEHRRGQYSTGFYAERSVAKRCKAIGLRGQEKCCAGILSAGLESNVHQRARLLRQ